MKSDNLEVFYDLNKLIIIRRDSKFAHDPSMISLFKEDVPNLVRQLRELK